METPKRISIDELEQILMNEEEVPIEILPSGEIVAKGSFDDTPITPLTYRENLGGEYAQL